MAGGVGSKVVIHPNQSSRFLTGPFLWMRGTRLAWWQLAGGVAAVGVALECSRRFLSLPGDPLGRTFLDGSDGFGRGLMTALDRPKLPSRRTVSSLTSSRRSARRLFHGPSRALPRPNARTERSCDVGRMSGLADEVFEVARSTPAQAIVSWMCPQFLFHGGGKRCSSIGSSPIAEHPLREAERRSSGDMGVTSHILRFERGRHAP